MERRRHVGIPTLYKGIRFRSRLEAKWANFFDRLGWQWEYEPFDCHGWIPDFILLGKTSVLVEVKPIVNYDLATEAKIDRANKKHQVLLVGSMPIWRLGERGNPNQPKYPGIFLGWLRDLDRELRPWSEAVIRKWGSSFGFCQYTGTTYDRMSGEDDGDFIDFKSSSSHKILQALWAKAQNETQWNKK